MPLSDTPLFKGGGVIGKEAALRRFFVWGKGFFCIDRQSKEPIRAMLCYLFLEWSPVEVASHLVGGTHFIGLMVFVAHSDKFFQKGAA